MPPSPSSTRNKNYGHHHHVESDAAIAQALASDYQEKVDADLARRMTMAQVVGVDDLPSDGRVVIPPDHANTGGGGVARATDISRRRPPHDVARAIAYPGNRNRSRSSSSPSAPPYHPGAGNNVVVPGISSARGHIPSGGNVVVPGTAVHVPHRTPQSPYHPPSGATTLIKRTPHMCIVPCVIGDICVEMMADSGAQSSVISLPLARELGLESRLDRSERGVAAGVGRASIVGKIRNVGCVLGSVEFEMDFLVLDVNDRMMLLGLDLMRKYKCIIDLEGEKLIFGGFGGVEVPMLPPEQQNMAFIGDALRNQMGCPVM